jgi:hypothetical protein
VERPGRGAHLNNAGGEVPTLVIRSHIRCVVLVESSAITMGGWFSWQPPEK